MRKRKIKVKSCFALGIVSSILMLGAGLLVTMGQGAANFLRMAAFVMFGAMLLFLAAAERGDEKRSTRIKLFLLFLGWMLAFFPLPPINGIFGAVIPVVFTAWYRKKQNTALWFCLLAAEIIQAIVLTFAIMPWYGSWHNTIVGGSMLLVGALRSAMLGFLYQYYAANEGQ